MDLLVDLHHDGDVQTGRQREGEAGVFGQIVAMASCKGGKCVGVAFSSVQVAV